MENRGSIMSCDLHAHKIALIAAGAERLGISIIESRPQDAAAFCRNKEQAFDAVIADVPCSGLGVIRKKPDIRYKDVAQLAGLPRVGRSWRMWRAEVRTPWRRAGLQHTRVRF